MTGPRSSTDERGPVSDTRGHWADGEEVDHALVALSAFRRDQPAFSSASTRNVDPTHNQAIANFVKRWRSWWRIADEQPDDLIRAMKMLLDRRSPMDFRMQEMPQAAPVTSLDHVEYIANRWNLLGHSES